jgi:hypothetical protein
MRFAHALLLSIAGALLARLPALPHRRFDPDELEHAHAAWLVAKGMLPYKDFFEHHTPWYYYVLRPFFNCFTVDASLADGTGLLLVGRGLSFALTALALWLLYRIGKRWEDQRTALVAALLLVAQPIFLHKTIEMRPDVLALPFLLGAIWLLLHALDAGAEAAGRTTRALFGGGLCLGAAIMCTQKMLFVLPGAMVGLGLWSLLGGARSSILARMLAVLAFVAGLAIPPLLTWLPFAAAGAGDAFVTNNFLLNAKWKHFATKQFVKLLSTSGPVLALALAGIGFRLRQRRYADVLLVSIVAGLFFGLLVVPVAHRQYYLMSLPILCLYAAKALFEVAGWLPQRVRPWFWTAAVLGLAVLPVLGLRSAFKDDNDHQLARLREVYETTAPSDLVMDGWEGMGVFRPHAFHYFFLHEEAVAMLPRPALDAYLDALETGRGRPKLIAMDKNLASLGPRFQAFVAANYVTRDGFFYLAKSSGKRTATPPDTR